MAKQLSYSEWIEKANKAYVKGVYTADDMVRDWGYPKGVDPNTTKMTFRSGRAGTKSRAAIKRGKAKSELERKFQGKAQTYGEADFPKGTSEIQQHHIRKKSQYAPFFEGATPAEQQELARYAAEDLGTPLGNKDLNAIAVNDAAHTLHHNVERQQGFTKRDFPKLTAEGPHPSSFKNATLDQRKYALYQFVNQEQPKIDDILIDAMRQADPKGLKAAQQSGTLVSTRGGLKFGRNLARFAAPAALGGLALSVLNQQSVRAETEGDDSMLANTRRTLADAGVAGDTLAATGMGLSATGVGAVVGVPMAAVGEAVSMGAGLAELATDAFVTNDAKAKEAVKRGGRLQANIGGLKFRMPELGLSERLGLN